MRNREYQKYINNIQNIDIFLLVVVVVVFNAYCCCCVCTRKVTINRNRKLRDNERQLKLFKTIVNYIFTVMY